MFHPSSSKTTTTSTTQMSKWTDNISNGILGHSPQVFLSSSSSFAWSASCGYHLPTTSPCAQVSDVISSSLIYPVVSAAIYGAMSKNSGFNLGGINATGQIMEGRFSLIDKDTPQDVYTKISPYDDRQLQLVFSDEFNVDGRTFWPGDDPFWVAEDLWYWYEFQLPFWNSLSDPVSGRHRTLNGERSGGRLAGLPTER